MKPELLEVGGSLTSLYSHVTGALILSWDHLSLFPHLVGQSTKERGESRRGNSPLFSGVNELDLVQMERPKASDF